MAKKTAPKKKAAPKKKVTAKKKVAPKKKIAPKKKVTPKKKVATKKPASKKKSGSVPALPRRRVTATGILESRLGSHKTNRLKDNPIPNTTGARKKGK